MFDKMDAIHGYTGRVILARAKQVKIQISMFIYCQDFASIPLDK
jgi:hypothetical protein